ncbi:glycosyltransferase [Candidatus Woesearchaeota archaeon]|nr:glycosyltransferase [Candidatus Woesearchaeota archaeon]MBT4764755.1 glycosyltransferase [bacterium]
MKILYVTRLFSGLESSFINGTWDPTGVPTIYKVIKELDEKYETKFIFSAKDDGDGYFSLWKNKKDSIFNIVGLRQSIHVLAGIDFFPKWVTRKIAIILRDFRQALFIILATVRFKPDIIYCDHANIIVAAILARYQNHTPVVFRAMGVYPFMRKALTPTNIIHYIFKWAYHSPFDLVICTQDGSGVELWLDNALRAGIKKEVLLNGVGETILPDVLDKQLLLLAKKKSTILFVGKLEKYKGCYEFIESILLLLEKNDDKIHALVIGTGNEKQQLKSLVERANCTEFFTFIDRLPHNQIAAAHKISEIYVSMNHLGNLSNSNLEAIQHNDCMVIPVSQPKIGVDVVTNRLLDDAVVNVPIQNPIELSKALNILINSKDKRDMLSKSVNFKKRDFLWSWEERIKVEINLLENLAKANL